MYNMGKGNVEVEAAADQLSEVSEDEFGNVIIKKRMNRQIEEGMYGKGAGGDFEFEWERQMSRNGSINAGFDEVDEDAFDQIID